MGGWIRERRERETERGGRERRERGDRGTEEEKERERLLLPLFIRAPNPIMKASPSWRRLYAVISHRSVSNATALGVRALIYELGGGHKRSIHSTEWSHCYPCCCASFQTFPSGLTDMCCKYGRRTRFSQSEILLVAVTHKHYLIFFHANEFVF
jgi:hypothetical protein